jgi:hypothetical protein
MRIKLLTSLVLGALVGTEAAGRDGEDRDLKALARGVWPVRHEKPAQQVLRNGEELAVAHGVNRKDAKDMRLQIAATEDVALLLKVRGIDWNKQMLIVVAAGAQPTGGYRVEVQSLAVKDGLLTVSWKLHKPAADTVVRQAVTYPAQMALVERFEGPVKFDPPKEK